MNRFLSSSSNLFAFFSEAWFLGHPQWNIEDIPDLTGKVVIVTGGNDGLGKDSVRALLAQNARVYMASRDETKTRIAIEELHSETGQKARFIRLDLSDLSSVKAAAKQFLRKESRLDILYNNAGIMGTPLEAVAGGYDLVFCTNVLGPFYFTKLLLPILQETAKRRDDGHARIVNLTSSAHHFSGNPPLDFNSFKDGPDRRKYTDLTHFYCQSKFAIILFSAELARRYGEKGIVSTAVNPGNFPTAISRNVKDLGNYLFTNYCLYYYPTQWGCITQLWAGTSFEAQKLNGKYLIPWGKVGRPRPEAEDILLATQLWTWLEEQLKEFESSA